MRRYTTVLLVVVATALLSGCKKKDASDEASTGIHEHPRETAVIDLDDASNNPSAAIPEHPDEAAISDLDEAPDKPSPLIPELPPKAAVVDGKPAVIDLVNGVVAGLPLGATADEFRKRAANGDLAILHEAPYRGDGMLMSLGTGYNVRFKSDGTSYQCYVNRKGVPLSGGLELTRSTVSEFEAHLGGTAAKGHTGGGLVKYDITRNELTFTLMPSADSNVVRFLMITRKSSTAIPEHPRKSAVVGGESAVIDLVNGAVAGLPLGATADEFRERAANGNLTILREAPYRGTGMLMTLGNGHYNVRFKADGTSYECYANRENAPLSGGLELARSTVSEFETHLGGTAVKGVANNGRVQYVITGNGLTFTLMPPADDSDIVRFLMITKR